MGFFDRFKRGRRGRRGGRDGSRGRGQGERRRESARRDPHMETEFVETMPPPPAAGPPPVASAPPLAAAPPPRAAVSPPRAGAPTPPPARFAPDGDAGKTRIVKVGLPPVSGVVAVLIGIDGKLRDEVFKVFDGENTLGRVANAEIYLGDRDDSISREHAQIIHREGAFGLRPLKEDNPTFINGDRVEGGAPLSDGDEVGLGDSKLRFRVV